MDPRFPENGGFPAVLACAESLISRISYENKFLIKTTLDCLVFIRGPDSFDPWNKKNDKKSRDTAPLKFIKTGRVEKITELNQNILFKVVTMEG